MGAKLAAFGQRSRISRWNVGEDGNDISAGFRSIEGAGDPVVFGPTFHGERVIERLEDCLVRHVGSFEKRSVDVFVNKRLQSFEQGAQGSVVHDVKCILLECPIPLRCGVIGLEDVLTKLIASLLRESVAAVGVSQRSPKEDPIRRF